MAVLLPFEIQNDLDLFSKNEELRQLRGDFIQALSQMETGSYSIKKLFRSLIGDLETLIDSLTDGVEAVVVPKADFADFELGLHTLDEYGSFDILLYYNGLKKIRHIVHGMRIALLIIQDVPVKPVTPSLTSSQGVLDSLDTREFIEQGAESPVFEAEQAVTYYTIIEGDTLQAIAGKVFNGDVNRWTEISQLNSLYDSDILDNDMVGTVIKIPKDAAGSNTFQSNNLVFEKSFDGTDQFRIDRFLYGRDLALFQGKFQISASGDLKRMEGIKGVIENIKNRFVNTKGALNPLNVDWGLSPIMNNGELPFIILLDRLLTDMEYQAMGDSRVTNASVLRRQVKVQGDTVEAPMEITLIGGKNVKDLFKTRNI